MLHILWRGTLVPGAQEFTAFINVVPRVMYTLLHAKRKPVAVRVCAGIAPIVVGKWAFHLGVGRKRHHLFRGRVWIPLDRSHIAADCRKEDLEVGSANNEGDGTGPVRRRCLCPSVCENEVVWATCSCPIICVGLCCVVLVVVWLWLSLGKCQGFSWCHQDVRCVKQLCSKKSLQYQKRAKCKIILPEQSLASSPGLVHFLEGPHRLVPLQETKTN